MARSMMLTALLVAFSVHHAPAQAIAPPDWTDSRSWCGLCQIASSEQVGEARPAPRHTPRMPTDPEVEPNDTIATAQVTDLGTGPTERRRITIAGAIDAVGDVDYYEFQAQPGDVLIAVAVGMSSLDTKCELLDGAGNLIQSGSFHIFSRSRAAQLSLPTSTNILSTGAPRIDGALEHIFQHGGIKYIAVTAESGPIDNYSLDVFLGRPGLTEDCDYLKTQVIYLDFDGISLVPADILDELVWGGIPQNPATTTRSLVGMDSELATRGYTPAEIDNIRDRIINRVTVALDSAMPSPSSGSYDLRNSRDHADPAGVVPEFARMIFFVDNSQLFDPPMAFIPAFAEIGDPGNLIQSDVAFLDVGEWLDMFSPPQNPPFTLADAIGEQFGSIAAHEIAHLITGAHTMSPANDINLGGISSLGNDFLLGTPDDLVPQFTSASMLLASDGLEGPANNLLRASYALSRRECLADFNGDRMFNNTDTNDFISAFVAQQASADLNQNGMWDNGDLNMFIVAFTTECGCI